jgi:saccharopine dehydrogenase-like NADP-dependent oxidoreductase
LLSTLHLDAASNQLRCLEWSGFLSDELIGLEKGTPAQILEHILNKKWKLSEGDKDHVVMWHRFTYALDEKTHEIQASMSVIGDDSVQTAMAKTVGLPLAIAAKLLIQRTLKNRGVVIPTSKEIYEPILKELSKLGIELKHH